MNKKESDEGSHDWEKARVAKELIRLEKQAAEKRARLKNKLKWLGKEPRASFFYFFFLALYFEKLRGQLVVPKAEHDINPLSAKALGTERITMKISHPRDDRPVIGGMTTNTDLDSLQKSESKTTKADEKNSLLLSHSNRRESPEMDLDELLRKFDISTVKNKPANGVFFPGFMSDFAGVEDILEYITETLLNPNIDDPVALMKKINKAWSAVYADFPEAFSWMDVKNEEQCIWVWNTLKSKGVSPPLNPLNNYQRWNFICATFDLWNGWTNEQLEELKSKRKKVNQHFLKLMESPQSPQGHKKILMTELEKAWAQQVRRMQPKKAIDLAALPAKSKKKLAKLSGEYGESEMEILVRLIDNECVRIVNKDLK